MRWITGILINAVLFIAIAGLFPDSIHVASFGAALGASFILSVLNILVRPILIIFTLPATVLTLGLFLFVINATTLFLTSMFMGDAFVIDSFLIAFMVAIFMSIANIIIQTAIIKPIKR